MENKTVTDLSYLREISMGDDQIIIETTEAFLEDLPNTLQQIKHSYRQQEWQQLAKLAHKIKPNLSYMGMEQAKTIIVDVEQQAKSGQISESLAARLQTFLNLCKQAEHELSQKINEIKA